MALRKLSPADVRQVALAYGSRDEWGVWYVYLPTLSRLMAMLATGVPASAIAAHASHVGPKCCALGEGWPG